MNILLKKISLCSAISMITLGAAATPIVNSTDRTKINVPASFGEVDYFKGANSSDLYISPPSTGSVSLIDFVPQNKSFCTDLARVRNTEQRTISTYLILQDQWNSLAIRYAEFEYVLDESGYIEFDENQNPVRKVVDGELVRTAFGEQLDTASEKMQLALAAKNTAQTAATTKKTTETLAKSARTTAILDLKDCRLEADALLLDPVDYCVGEQESYNEARQAYSDARVASIEAADNAFLKDLDYQLALAEFNILEDRLTSNTQRVADLRNSVDTERTRLSGLYKEIASIFGGQVNMSYRTNWADAVTAFQNANKSKSIRRVNVYNPSLFVPATSVDAEKNPGLAQTIGTAWSVLNIANRTFRSEFNEDKDGLDEPKPIEAMLGWSDSFQGNVGLFLPNSCVMQEGTPGLSGSALNNKYSQNFNQYLSPKIEYTYDVRADFGYKATYNLSKFVEVINTVSKKSGFFSSKTKSETEKEFSEDRGFVMHYIQDANGGFLTEAEKKDLELAVRGRLMKEVLDSIGNRVINEDPNLAIIPPSETGASVLSKTLRKSCYYGWGYACVGGWALYTVGSIFGNKSEAMTRYQEENNYEATEEKIDHFFVPINRGISFERN